MTIEIDTIELSNVETQKPVVYNDRPELDKFTLTLTTDTPFALNGKTAIGITFPTNVVKAATVGKMTVSDENWVAEVIPGRPTLGLTYVGEPGKTATISIALAGITSEKSGTHGDVSVRLYHGTDGADDAVDDVTAGVKLVVQQFPSTGARDLGDVVDFSLTGLGGSSMPATVERSPAWDPGQSTTKIENELTFAIWNTRAKALLSGKKAQEWPDGTPTVRLSFAYGSGVGALTSDGKPRTEHPFSAWNIKAKTREAQESGGTSFPWVTTNPSAGAVTPVWTLKPTNNAVLGSSQGTGAVAAFVLKNVATQAPPGLTQMFVSWTGFPGFNDDYQAMQIEKVEPEPKIVNFEVPEFPSTVAWGQSFDVSWQTRNVDRVELTWRDNSITERVDSNDPKISKTKGRHTITRKKQQTAGEIIVTLTAFKDDIEIDESPATRTVTIDFPALAFESFTVSPTRGIQKTNGQTVGATKGAVGPVDLKLNWSINHPELVEKYLLIDYSTGVTGIANEITEQRGPGPYLMTDLGLEPITGHKVYTLEAFATYADVSVMSDDARIILSPPAHGRVKVTAARGTKSLLTPAKILVVGRPDGGAPSCDLAVMTGSESWAVSVKKPPAKPKHQGGSTERITLPKSFSGLPHVRLFGEGGDIADPEFDVIVAIESLDRHLDGRKYRSKDGISVWFEPGLSMSCEISRALTAKVAGVSQTIEDTGQAKKMTLKPKVTPKGQFQLTGFTVPVTGAGKVTVKGKVGFGSNIPVEAQKNAVGKGSYRFQSLELMADGRLSAQLRISMQISYKDFWGKKRTHAVSDRRVVILELEKEPSRDGSRRPKKLVFYDEVPAWKPPRPGSARVMAKARILSSATVAARKPQPRKATAPKPTARKPPPSRTRPRKSSAPKPRARRGEVQDHRKK